MAHYELRWNPHGQVLKERRRIFGLADVLKFFCPEYTYHLDGRAVPGIVFEAAAFARYECELEAGVDGDDGPHCE